MESFREKPTDRAFARTCWTIDGNNHPRPLIHGASPASLVVLILSLNVAFYPIVPEISSFLLRPLPAAVQRDVTHKRDLLSQNLMHGHRLKLDLMHRIHYFFVVDG